jgi:hypothetical protein
MVASDEVWNGFIANMSKIEMLHRNMMVVVAVVAVV